MSDSGAPAPPKRVLDPIERLSEVLFGLIMVLTFTGSLSVATAERGEVREMLIGAIGCNLAWGLIDAIMYLMACLNDRGATLRTVLAIRSARSDAEAHAAIRSELPPVAGDAIGSVGLESIRAKLLSFDLPTAPRLNATDWRGALAVFLIVFGAILPVLLPFMFLSDASSAMRVSNLIAVAMLAAIGFFYGRASGLPAVYTSAVMVVLGAAIVALTIALGG